MGLVGSLELATAAWREAGCHELAIVGWWVLLLTYGSMRYDDALHVSVPSLALEGDVLRLRSWQTKVDRSRLGTEYHVLGAGVASSSWLRAGWESFKETAPLAARKQDFILFDTEIVVG